MPGHGGADAGVVAEAGEEAEGFFGVREVVEREECVEGVLSGVLGFAPVARFGRCGGFHGGWRARGGEAGDGGDFGGGGGEELDFAGARGEGAEGGGGEGRFEEAEFGDEEFLGGGGDGELRGDEGAEVEEGGGGGESEGVEGTVVGYCDGDFLVWRRWF